MKDTIKGIEYPTKVVRKKANTMNKLTKEQVLAIPSKLKTMGLKALADEYGVHANSIRWHIKKLNAMGADIKVKRGRKPLISIDDVNDEAIF